MHANTVVQQPNRNSQAAPSASSLLSRLPRRSLRQVFAVPLSGDGRPSILRNEVASQETERSKDLRPRIEVAAIPSSDGNCRHHLFIEDGTRLKKLDLPATACVAVTQRFEARAGDTLTYDYVVRLHSNGFAADRPAVRAVLVNRKAESAISLMDRSLAGRAANQQQCAGSRFRQSQSFTVPTAGHYELRFITLIDRSRPGSEAHLLVNSVRVVNPYGQEVKRLASLSCVGRVQQPVPDESVN